MPADVPTRIGYVLKMYPRFSETFIVTEMLAREAAGERLTIFSLRPPVDPRFHPELSRIAAPVRYLDRPVKTVALWDALRVASTDPQLAAAIGAHFDELLRADVDDAAQAVLLADACRREQITHLHAHFASIATTVARLAALLVGIPYSFTAHAKDIFHDSVDVADLSRKFADAAFAVTVSDYNRDFLARTLHRGAHRAVRVYNGLELARFRYRPPRPPGDVLRVLAVGRLVEKKGFEVLVDAAARLAADGVRFQIDLVGEGERERALRERIQAAGMGPHVRLLGARTQEEVAVLLDRADVFVAPCVVGADGNADGLPTVLLEAMATGTVCVSTTVTGIPEVIHDGRTGLLCRPGDVGDLAGALRRVATGALDLRAIAQRAREVIEREFDSRRQADALRRATVSVAATVHGSEAA
ncbi:glycosyltransferase [Microbacterium sp.]|uniref:glycosyltransferase n=1 Tax=Microbacterium sp. TaxID=51671 RepID=UPI003A8BC026